MVLNLVQPPSYLASQKLQRGRRTKEILDNKRPHDGKSHGAPDPTELADNGVRIGILVEAEAEDRREANRQHEHDARLRQPAHKVIVDPKHAPPEKDPQPRDIPGEARNPENPERGDHHGDDEQE